MADSSAPQIPTTKSHNVQNANTRGSSSSRKRPLSGSDEQMKPPSSRQRSQSVTRKVPNPGSKEQVTIKTQGQSFNMCKLVETTMLKPEIIQTVVSTIIGEIKTELISERNKIAITQAIEDAIKPLQDCINKQNVKITSLKAENEQMKGKLNKRIEQIEDRYDKFRNMANVCPRILQKTTI